MQLLAVCFTLLTVSTVILHEQWNRDDVKVFWDMKRCAMVKEKRALSTLNGGEVFSTPSFRQAFLVTFDICYQDARYHTL
jgi:hypothetical protein